MATPATATDTALGAAFERAGIKKPHAQFGAAAMRFLQQTRSEEEAIAVVREAAEKLRARGLEISRTGREAGRTLQDIRSKMPLPIREPSAAQRDAARSVAKTITVTMFETYKLMDGRSIGDVVIGELGRVASGSLHNFYVIKQIQTHAVADHDRTVREVIKHDMLQRFIQKAAEMCDDATT